MDAIIVVESQDAARIENDTHREFETVQGERRETSIVVTVAEEDVARAMRDALLPRFGGSGKIWTNAMLAGGVRAVLQGRSTLLLMPAGLYGRPLKAGGNELLFIDRPVNAFTLILDAVRSGECLEAKF